jgi:hypothetical protein
MPDATEILARYLRKGRLRQIPARQEARLVVLGWLAARFEPGRVYSEPETNALLDGHEIDHATLRRLLVDYGLLARDRTGYWRPTPPAPDAGGSAPP